MTHLKTLLWLLAAAFAIAACSDQDEAAQHREEADRVAEDTARAVEETPGMPAAPRTVPAPENVAAAPADATRTPSGLAYVVLEDAPGTDAATVQDTVTVHYTGWTTDGQMFDSSVTRGEPATFPLNQLIPGWQEAIPLMTVGDTYRFWIPGSLAYDNSTRPGAPKGTLVFDIELIAVEAPGEAATDEQPPAETPGEATESSQDGR